MVRLTDKAMKMIEGKNFATVVTLMPDGSPHATIVWIDHNAENLIVNTSIGRRKEKNMRRDPRVAISIFDSQNPYNSISIKGKVARITEEGADAHIDKMSMKYLGKEKYPYRSKEEKRVIVEIEPLQISYWG